MAALATTEKPEAKEESTSRYVAFADKDDHSNNETIEPSVESMELEHMIGISTYFRQCFVQHTQKSNLYLHALGSIIVISDFSDPLSNIFEYIFLNKSLIRICIFIDTINHF